MLVFTGQPRSPAVSFPQSDTLDVARITLLMFYHKNICGKIIKYIFMAELNIKKHTIWPTDAYLAS